MRLPRGGLRRIVSNQFYSQSLELHHQTAENFHPNQRLKLLQQQVKDNPRKTDSAVVAIATADLGTAATQSNVNIHWLYTLCQQAKVSMVTDVSPLGISLVVLRALHKFEIDIPESTDEDDDTFRTNDYANHFFEAFKDSSIFMRRDVDFIYELAEKVWLCKSEIGC
jgi:hypothetical protein